MSVVSHDSMEGAIFSFLRNRLLRKRRLKFANRKKSNTGCLSLVTRTLDFHSLFSKAVSPGGIIANGQCSSLRFWKANVVLSSKVFSQLPVWLPFRLKQSQQGCLWSIHVPSNLNLTLLEFPRRG